MKYPTLIPEEPHYYWFVNHQSGTGILPVLWNGYPHFHLRPDPRPDLRRKTTIETMIETMIKIG